MTGSTQLLEVAVEERPIEPWLRPGGRSTLGHGYDSRRVRRPGSPGDARRHSFAGALQGPRGDPSLYPPSPRRGGVPGPVGWNRRVGAAARRPQHVCLGEQGRATILPSRELRSASRNRFSILFADSILKSFPRAHSRDFSVCANAPIPEFHADRSGGRPHAGEPGSGRT